MSDVSSPLPTAEGAPQLRRNSLDIRHAIIISVAVMSPAASVFFNTVPQGAAVGAAIPLCYVIGFVIALLVANSFSEFSREIPSSGSSYSFVTKGIGPRFGFMSAWAGLLAVVLGVPYTFVGLSSNLQTIVKTAFNVNVTWIFWFVLLLGIAFAICYSGIRQSLNVDFTFLAIEVGVCLILVGIVLFQVGQQGGLSTAPFTLSVIPGHNDTSTLVTNLIQGIIFGVLSFIGFETAASLGSETHDPHRNIPRAVFGSMIIVGLFYILMVYTEAVGYPGGMSKIATDFANPNLAAPFDTISRHYAGWFTIFVDLVGVFSFFSAAIAILNGSARIIFTVAREGLLPGFLGYLHPTRNTPVGAVSFMCIVGGVIGLIIGLVMAPTNAFAFFGTLDALAVMIIYALVCVGTLLFFRRQRRAKFNPLLHGVLPVLATVMIGAIFLLVFVTSLTPPTGISPGSAAGILFSDIPFIVAGWVVIGVVVIVALGKKLSQPVAL